MKARNDHAEIWRPRCQMTARRTRADAQHAVNWGGIELLITEGHLLQSRPPSLAPAGLRLSLYTVWMSCQCVQGILGPTKTHTLLKQTHFLTHTHTCCQQGWLSIKEVFYLCINWLKNEL